MKRVYLDWNATAPLDSRVLDRMMPYLREQFGNPSSLHEPGRASKRAIEDSRESVARAIGADPKEVIFCSGATEANNLAVGGIGGEGFSLVSAIEHPSVLDSAREQARAGAARTIPVTRDGSVDLDALEDALAARP